MIFAGFSWCGFRHAARRARPTRSALSGQPLPARAGPGAGGAARRAGAAPGAGGIFDREAADARTTRTSRPRDGDGRGTSAHVTRSVGERRKVTQLHCCHLLLFCSPAPAPQAPRSQATASGQTCAMPMHLTPLGHHPYLILPDLVSSLPPLIRRRRAASAACPSSSAASSMCPSGPPWGRPSEPRRPAAASAPRGWYRAATAVRALAASCPRV